jgi:hypothetical protein
MQWGPWVPSTTLLTWEKDSYCKGRVTTRFVEEEELFWLECETRASKLVVTDREQSDWVNVLVSRDMSLEEVYKIPVLENKTLYDYMGNQYVDKNLTMTEAGLLPDPNAEYNAIDKRSLFMTLKLKLYK